MSILCVLALLSLPLPLVALPFESLLKSISANLNIDASEPVIASVNNLPTSINKNAQEAVAKIGNEARLSGTVLAEKTGQEMRHSTTHFAEQCNKLYAHIFTSVKALPVIALGCATGYYALGQVKQGIERMVASSEASNKDEQKRALLQTLAGTSVVLASIAMIAKSEAIIGWLA